MERIETLNEGNQLSEAVIEVNDPAIGVRIRKARLRAGLTLHGLAQASHTSRNWIAFLERGAVPGRGIMANAAVHRVLHVLALQLPKDSDSISDEVTA
jgi:transcriptional regulator with XRE-family HTH domain